MFRIRDTRNPDKQKHSETGENRSLEYAVSTMTGYRLMNEDAHVADLDLDVSTNTSVFGVYDGHGGPAVAKYCARHLHTEVLQHAEFADNLPNAVTRAFFRMDEMLVEPDAQKEIIARLGNISRSYFEARIERVPLPSCIPFFWQDRVVMVYRGPFDEGCTACVVLIRNNQIVVANAGDSRCVLSRNGQAIALSTDHKPSDRLERARIERAGWALAEVGGLLRINGSLSVSRAIGDLRYKQNRNLSNDQQAITSSPDIRSEQITADTDFLVIACDGIWDVFSNQYVVDFVRHRMRFGSTLKQICKAILEKAVTLPNPSMDNMTFMLVRFKHPSRSVREVGGTSV